MDSCNLQESYFFIPEAMAATKARKEEILGVLVARGWQAVDAAEILGSDKWGGPVTWYEGKHEAYSVLPYPHEGLL